MGIFTSLSFDFVLLCVFLCANELHAFDRNLPKAVPPAYRYDLVMAGIFCHEGHIIEEWLNHHWNEGVEHFFLIDNCNSTKGDQPLLQPYIKSGIVTLFVDTSRHSQVSFYNKIILPEVLPPVAKWVILGDLDEFYYAPYHSTITSALDMYFDHTAQRSGGSGTASGEGSHKGCVGVAVPWLVFGSNGLRTTPRSAVQAMTRRANMSTVAMQNAIAEDNLDAAAASMRGGNEASTKRVRSNTLVQIKTIARTDAIAALHVHSHQYLPSALNGGNAAVCLALLRPAVPSTNDELPAADPLASDDMPSKTEAQGPIDQRPRLPPPSAMEYLYLPAASNHADIFFRDYYVSEADIPRLFLRINHYRVQAADYFQNVKSMRGSAVSGRFDKVRNEAYRRMYDRNEVEDRGLAERQAKRMVAKQKPPLIRSAND